MSCAHCGVQVPAEARVCPRCGYVFAAHERAAARNLRQQILVVVAVAIAAGVGLALILPH